MTDDKVCAALFGRHPQGLTIGELYRAMGKGDYAELGAALRHLRLCGRVVETGGDEPGSALTYSLAGPELALQGITALRAQDQHWQEETARREHLWQTARQAQLDYLERCVRAFLPEEG